jgi:NADH dehydrogenase
MDPNTGKPYPPTAQHALRQARIVAANVAFAIRAKKSRRIKKRKFDYKTKGMMALIGRRNGVGILFGHKIQGFSAWAIWRFYYLSTLPTVQKKLRVMVDWFVDLFFKRDVTRLKMSQTDSTVLRSIVSDGREAE